MSTQTKEYGPLAVVLAVTLGVASGIVFAIFKLKLPKLMFSPCVRASSRRAFQFSCRRSPQSQALPLREELRDLPVRLPSH